MPVDIEPVGGALAFPVAITGPTVGDHLERVFRMSAADQVFEEPT